MFISCVSAIIYILCCAGSCRLTDIESFSFMFSSLHLNKPYSHIVISNLQPNLIKTYHLLFPSEQADWSSLCGDSLNRLNVLRQDKCSVWWREKDHLYKSVTDDSIDPHWPLHLITITLNSQYCLFAHWWGGGRLTSSTLLFYDHIKLNQTSVFD